MQRHAQAVRAAGVDDPASAPPSRWPTRTVRPVPPQAWARPAHPVPPRPPVQPAAVPEDLRADLLVDGRRVHISLVGVTGGGPGFAYDWRSAAQPPPAATLPVVLGESNSRRLCLDLGRCPDAMTVAGRLPVVESFTLRLVRQIVQDGRSVAVLGDELFGGALPAGCRRLATLRELRGLHTPGVVVCGRLTGRDLTAARLSRASGGPIPILIGDVPRARWSVRIGHGRLHPAPAGR